LALLPSATQVVGVFGSYPLPTRTRSPGEADDDTESSRNLPAFFGIQASPFLPTFRAVMVRVQHCKICKQIVFRRMSLTHLKGLVAVPITGLLKQREFRKSGLKFYSIRSEANLLVGLQSSVGTTREALKITCNLAIVLHALGSRDDHDIWDSHWRKRIGDFMAEPRDHWWVCLDDETATEAGREMAALLESQALSEMEQLASRTAMIALWTSGRSPGLTEYQRAQYRQELAQ
jgi:uncharacterized protein DUF4304